MDGRSRFRRARDTAGALAALLAVAAWGPTGGAGAQSAAGPKPPMQGVIDRQELPPPEWAEPRGPVGGRVLRVAWRDLQDANLALRADNPIDAALQALPPGFTLKVRLLAGADAPEWLEAQAGTVRLSDPQSGTDAIVRWWDPSVKTAYDALISGLAARYDADARIRDWTISRCMTFTAEPLLRPLGSPGNRQALWAAGLRPELDQQCQEEAVRAHAAFQSTRSSLAVNPYQKLVSASRSKVDQAYTSRLMRQCRSILGSRCILANNSLRNDARSRQYDRLYKAMQSLGPPITFQTANAGNFGQCEALLSVLDRAVTLGASSVELPFNYSRICSPGQVEPKDAALEANPLG